MALLVFGLSLPFIATEKIDSGLLKVATVNGTAGEAASERRPPVITLLAMVAASAYWPLYRYTRDNSARAASLVAREVRS